MNLRSLIIFILFFVIIVLSSLHVLFSPALAHSHDANFGYWFFLQRKSNIETLYFGLSGDMARSMPIRTFQVKTGIPGQRPTPLPELYGKKYWTIISKMKIEDNLETAPYFLTLDIPGINEAPYGPVPYLECNGQCNWELPGAFGLHGVNGDISRLSSRNPGSSGCIRHSDKDITYLYQVLEKTEGVRYYIKDI